MQRQWLSCDTCLLPTCVMGSPLICCACGGYSSLSNLQRPHPGADVGKPSSSHSLPAPPTIVRDGLVPSSSIISPTTSSKLIRSPSFNGSVCRAMTHFHYTQSYQLYIAFVFYKHPSYCLFFKFLMDNCLYNCAYAPNSICTDLYSLRMLYYRSINIIVPRKGQETCFQ